MAKKRCVAEPPEPEPVAGNGLLHRRALLGRGILIAGAMGTGVGASLTGAAAEPLTEGPWSLKVGSIIPPYQTRCWRGWAWSRSWSTWKSITI